MNENILSYLTPVQMPSQGAISTAHDGTYCRRFLKYWHTEMSNGIFLYAFKLILITIISRENNSG
jgi:hypothetical protein